MEVLKMNIKKLALIFLAFMMLILSMSIICASEDIADLQAPENKGGYILQQHITHIKNINLGNIIFMIGHLKKEVGKIVSDDDL